MQPTEKKELEAIIKEAKAAGKPTAELEKILADEQIPEPPKGETLETDIEEEVWMPTALGAKKKKEKGKRVIISTGPAREDDFR